MLEALSTKKKGGGLHLFPFEGHPGNFCPNHVHTTDRSHG